MTNIIVSKFLDHYPGPYKYQGGTDGVDNTFDIYCSGSGNHIASMFYWDDRLPSEVIAKLITESLNATNPENDSHPKVAGESMSEREIAMFRGMYSGSYRSVAAHCDYRGPGYEVLSGTVAESVVFVYDRAFRGQAKLVSEQIAVALNAMC